VFAKAVDADLNISVNDVKLAADDAIAETDKSFSSGTLTIGIDDFSSKAKVDTLGYVEGAVVDAVTGEKELTTAGASAPYIGFGFYSKGTKSNTKYWRAIWLKKVMFGEPSDTFKAQGETVEFQTQTVTGTILTASYDSTLWKEEARFSTEAAAIAWLYSKAGISSGASNNITALTITAGTLTPTFAATTRNYSCVCTGNIDFTATFAAGTAKVYVDGVYNQTLATTVKGSSITMGTGTQKFIQIVVQESGKSPITYQIMATRA
jgi:phi13 family phage major tail protein